MSGAGLKFGELVLDSKKFVYLPSIGVLACAGLQEALGHPASKSQQSMIEAVDAVVLQYKPEAFIIIGPLTSDIALNVIAKRWGKKTRLQLVSQNFRHEVCAVAEKLGFEVHRELIWDRYRFTESHDLGEDLPLFTISCRPQFRISVGGVIKAHKLGIFLKGNGHLVLPSLNVLAGSDSLFSRASLRSFDRYDVFAVGRNRVFPLGKVAGLKSRKGILHHIPLSRAVLAGKRAALKKDSKKGVAASQ